MWYALGVVAFFAVTTWVSLHYLSEIINVSESQGGDYEDFTDRKYYRD